MKKLLLVWIALILFSTVPACAEDDASDLRIDLDVGAIRFTVPEGFRITSNTADDLIMENDDYATLKVRMCDSAGYTLEECIEHIDEYIYYDDIEVRYKGPINNCELFSLDYRYNYSGLDIYGNYIGILDDSDNTLYIFHYYATRTLNLADENAINNLIFSICFRNLPEPTVTPTPIPTPTPTSAPTTSAFFDYDELVVNPVPYKNLHYTIVGNISRITDYNLHLYGITFSTMGMVMIEGDEAKPIYIIFNNPDDTIQDGMKINAFASFLGNMNVKSILGFYAKMPVFAAYSISTIE